MDSMHARYHDVHIYEKSSAIMYDNPDTDKAPNPISPT